MIPPSPTHTALLSDIRSAAMFAAQSDQCQLPVLPEVSVQLMKLTADVDCNPADIVNLFKRDQSLTGHLLKTANSVRYSSGQTVTSIQQAVARLGLLHVREIVMLISCRSRIFNVEGFETDVRRSFERSLATAAFAQAIARVRRLNVEDAFLCGLLHDVGRPVLLQELSDHRAEADIDCSDDAIRSAAEEFRIPMACRLVTSWDLPDRIAAVIDHQDRPLEAGELEQQAAMNRMAIDLADLALAYRLPEPPWVHPMADLLTLYPEDIVQILSKGPEIIEWVNSTT
ncbi:MAG: HDOD domain-containing protein [Planctomycetaceae bacterium]